MGVDVGILVGVGVFVGMGVGVDVNAGVMVGKGVGVGVAAGFRVRDASVILIVGVRLSSVTICIFCISCVSDLRNNSDVLSLGITDTFVKLKLANSITPVGRVWEGGTARTIVARPVAFASAIVDF